MELPTWGWLTCGGKKYFRPFLTPMQIFEPLTHNPFDPPQANNESHAVNMISEFSTFMKLSALNPSKAHGPDGIPAWLLKENADLLAGPVSAILNSSFHESRLPPSWKEADVVPVPKQRPINDINKHLRPISLTPILSKLAEDHIVEKYVKPAVLQRIDPRQFGTIPKSSTTHALVNMTHNWLVNTDGNGAQWNTQVLYSIVLYQTTSVKIWNGSKEGHSESSILTCHIV